MNLARILSLTLALAFGAAAAASAQAPPLPEVDRLGPLAGETVPPFSLVDQHGEARDLQSLMGPNGLMLVFSRSADW